MRLSDHQSFRRAAVAVGVQPRQYQTSHDAHPAVDILADIERCGDRVLALTREGRMSPDAAESLLQGLIACFAAPLETAADLARIRHELWRFEA